MYVDLGEISADLLKVNKSAVVLCEGLSSEECARQVSPGKWSISENLIHLKTVTQTFLPWTDHAIETTRKALALAEGPFEVKRYAKLLVWYVEPPPVIRLPAPKKLKPVLPTAASNSLEDFLESQEWMFRRMETAHGLDLTRFRFSSPLASYVRMNLLELFMVFNGHSRRHLWQAEQVRKLITAK